MKTAFFADVSNLYYCIGKRHEGRKLDYKKLLDYIRESGDLQRATAYGTQIEDEAKSFITCLKKLGYDTKYRKTKVTEAEDKKTYRYTSWNVGIAIDVVRVIGRVDVIILGSADAELVPLAQWVKDQGVRVVVLACGISKELKEMSDQFIEIDETFLETQTIPTP